MGCLQWFILGVVANVTGAVRDDPNTPTRVNPENDADLDVNGLRSEIRVEMNLDVVFAVDKSCSSSQCNGGQMCQGVDSRIRYAKVYGVMTRDICDLTKRIKGRRALPQHAHLQDDVDVLFCNLGVRL